MTDGEELKEFQKKALELINTPGIRSVLIVAPPGFGKTYFGSYLVCNNPGPHLIIVPTTTLISTWKSYIEKMCPGREDYVIYTYAGALRDWRSKYKILYRVNWDFVIFDEAHYLLGEQYRKIFNNLKYRKAVLLTATPFKEELSKGVLPSIVDAYLMMKWTAKVGAPVLVRVVIAPEKMKDQVTLDVYRELVSRGLKPIIVYTERVEDCKRLGKLLGTPCFWGGIASTRKKKLSLFGMYVAEYLNKKPWVLVMTRVGEEGIHLPTIKAIIEYGWLGRSERQVLQRLGRLLHTPGGGEYVIVTTPSEYIITADRAGALRRRGYKVVIDRTYLKKYRKKG